MDNFFKLATTTGIPWTICLAFLFGGIELIKYPPQSAQFYIGLALLLVATFDGLCIIVYYFFEGKYQQLIRHYEGLVKTTTEAANSVGNNLKGVTGSFDEFINTGRPQSKPEFQSISTGITASK